MCPAPTPVFTGQGDKIKQLTTCILRGDKERCVFVVHGMGGAGKTQIVLKAIENTQDMWTDIVFVDAMSKETATSTLEGFAKAKGIGNTYEDTIRWLGGRRERWLVVFDNADNSTLHVSDFFPMGNHGSILITTRVPDMALLARGPDSDCSVSSMDPKEALELLIKAARLQGGLAVDSEREAALRLLEVRSLHL
jgi:hypothetical protein